ncbi:MAG TPA: hypothetical protein VN777_14145 [Terriglobales bacterium]|nr:hypothetical protein [Terriglobales bacterium]
MAEENERNNSGSAEEEPVEQALPVETGDRPGWREIFRQAFERARRENRPANRSGLGRDRSRSLFLLVGAAIAVLLLFLGVFSSPNHSRKPANARPAGSPDLGQRATPGQQAAGQTGSVAPLLSAQTGQAETPGNQGVTAADVDKTARPIRMPGVQPKALGAPTPAKAGPYALGQIDFSDAAARERAPEPASSAKSESDDLRKPSLVFVRNVQNASTGNGTRVASTETEEGPVTLALPSGTKLIARLESLVTSAVKEPVVAAIEYNYERDGEIVVPAGAKALGSLQQADRSGSVGIRFTSIQMPDGTTEKIDATSMSLTYGPLKGTVSGKKTGTNFLVRTFTGLGQAATYLVGSGGVSAPLSESAFLRDRIATNIGIAGDQELNNLTFNQNIVVTVPGNTRFYLVMEHGASLPEGQAQTPTSQQASTTPPPSMEELRQLLQLRQEMSAMYQQAGSPQSEAQQVPQQ